MAEQSNSSARTISPLLDLSEALAQHLSSTANVRADTEHAHVADLYGCDLQTWARRRGLFAPVFRAPMSMLHEIGFAVEKILIAAVENSVSSMYERQKIDRLFMWLEGDEVVGRAATDDEPVPEGVLVGHPDAVFHGLSGQRFVLECKTEVFKTLRGVAILPKEPKPKHVLQACAYALALGCEVACVWRVCRASGASIAHWLDPREHKDDIVRRMREVLKTSCEDAPQPSPPPWDYWFDGTNRFCSYCGYVACRLNPLQQQLELGGEG